jgi:acetyl-CoA acetyltransferase family protein
VRPDDLAALVIAAAVERAGLDPSLVDDVILGNANGAGEENRNVARMAALVAGFPVSVAGQTVNRLCGSGLQAVNTAAHAIMAGDGDVFVAGGVESMTRAPLVMLKPETAFERGEHAMVDTTLGWRFPNPRLTARHGADSMGETGENVAERCGVSREAQDAFALRSQQRTAAAIDSGRFATQLVPVPVTQRDGSVVTIDRAAHARIPTRRHRDRGQ